MYKVIIPERKSLIRDTTAGLTFAVVNIPQAMANALLAGVNPVLGLYTLMIGTPLGALFTGAVYMNVSTTSALSVAAGDALLNVPSGSKAVSLAALVLMVGVVQLLAGVFKLGSYMRFVAKSVMVGFVTGVALLIILGQVSALTGYNSPFSGKVLSFADTLLHFRQYNMPTFFIGMLTILVIIGMAYTPLKKFGFIIAIIVATLAVQLFNLDSVLLVSSIATIPDQLFNFSLPTFSAMLGLAPSAVAVAIIGLVQGAGITQTFPNPDGKYADVSRDFVGQGLSNIGTSFFQGIPGGGSMSGTALMVNTGMVSRWGNVLAGLFVIPLVLILSNFIELIPMSTLAGLLIVVGYQSIRPEDINLVWQTGAIPRIGMGLTLIATLTLPLQYAVFVGMAVSILLYVFRSSNQVRVVQLQLVPNGYPIEIAVPEKLEDNQVVVLNTFGSLFFAAAATFEKQLPKVENAQHAVVIIRLRGRDDVGSTLLAVLERYHVDLKKNNGRLLLV
ncbi:MAG: SulP family inorganic anion transporter, partial [Anaerolineae bacterium]|nr:SulP family inorganic anion transporter [Anaerolineae bacterium]